MALTLPVVWLNYWPGTCDSGRRHWDQTQLIGMLDRAGVKHWYPAEGDGWPDTAAAVVVVPGGFAHGDLDRVNKDLARYDRVLVVIASDERSLFPYETLEHPSMRLWVMTPRPDRGEADGYLGEGWSPGTPDVLSGIGYQDERGLPWSFSGQVTHRRRDKMVSAIRELPAGLAADHARFLMTDGFTQGVPQGEYLATLAATKVALAPSGPHTPDSFRLYEALEAGCFPIVDAFCSAYSEPGYWERLFGVTPPFMTIRDWDSLYDYLMIALEEWPGNAAKASAFWQCWKRDQQHRLNTELERLDGVDRTGTVTVLMPTSPIPSHPSTAIIEQTVGSVRAQLPDAEIILMCDGVRPEQADRYPAYEAYLHRLMWLANHEWHNVYPMAHNEHLHQAEMTRRALDRVTTPLVLFCEHDTPIVGDIQWQALNEAVLSGEANLIRLHHEHQILNEHRYLMLDREPQDVCGAPLSRTIQWSQRPHLASTAFYRRLIETYFGENARSMLEDTLHGPLQAAYKRDGEPGWHQWRTWIYTPDGNTQRSIHLDGRETDEKYEMEFAYPGATPYGAPHPGRR